MAYVGNSPEKGNFRKADSITCSATATYNLLVGGVAVNPNQNQCIVSLNGVIQSSGNSYTIASSQITFASALTSSDVIDFILILGDTLDVGVPSDDTVDASKITANVITGQSALGATPADTDELLISDAGTLKRVDYSYLKSSVVNRPNAQPIMINGNFEVWQRGTSFTSSEYTCDRWKQDLSGATATVSRQTFTVGQSDVPNNPKYHLRQAASTANNNCGIFYRHEDVTTLTGNITISFYAKGTNPNGGNLHIITKQSFGSGGSTAVETSTQNLTLTASWQQFVFNFSLASISGKTVGASSYLQILIKQPDGDASTNAWTLDLANFQVEDDTYTSSTLPPFQFESYGDNLARCQRYFQYSTMGYYSDTTGGGYGGATTFAVEHRATPSYVSGYSSILGNNNRFNSTVISSANNLSQYGLLAQKAQSTSSDSGYFFAKMATDAEL